MAQLFTIFFQLLVSLVSGVISIISKLTSVLISLFVSGAKKYGEKQNIKTLHDIVNKIESARKENSRMLSFAEQVKAGIPKEAKEYAMIVQMVNYCNETERTLKTYSDNVDRDMSSATTDDLNFMLSKHQIALQFISSINYPISETDLQSLMKNYQGASYFIETMLNFAKVGQISKITENMWSYRTPNAFYQLELHEPMNEVSITAKPNNPISFRDNPKRPWKFVKPTPETVAYFNENRQLEIKVNRKLSDIDHYDISEFFDYVQHLVRKPEINPYSAKKELSLMEAEELEENIETELQGFQQTAPPPADLVPDDEKMHGGKQRWAQLEDLRKAGMLQQEGFIIGKLGYGSYVYTGRYDSHILTIASVGSGKGVGVVIPNLLRHKGSAVVLDPKGENFIITAKKRKDLGNKVFYYDPWEVIDSYNKLNHGTVVHGAIKATINPLDFISPDSLDIEDNARMLASSLILRTDSSGDFFYNGAETLIARLIVFVCTTMPMGSPDRNMLSVRALVTMQGRDLMVKLVKVYSSLKASGKKLHPMVIDLMNWLDDNLKSKARSFADIFSFAQQATEFLSNVRVSKAFETSNINILELKTNPTSLYLILDMDKLLFVSDNYKPLVRLIITTCMMGASVRTVAKEKLLFMLDEIAQLGNLQYLPNLLSIYRSKGVVVWTIWQNIAQIQSNYEKEWQTIVGNCDVQQYFGVNDQETAKIVSEAAGQTTIYKEAYTTSESTSRGESYSDSQSRSSGRGTSEQVSKNSGYSYQGFNFSHSGGSGTSSGTSENYTDSYSFSKSIQIGHSHTSGQTLTKEAVPLITPFEVTTGNAYSVQFVFYKNKCPYPILSGKIRYYQDLEFYGEFSKNITILK